MEIVPTNIAFDDFEPKEQKILEHEVKEPIWLSVSSAALLCGVQDKTIRRAIKSGELRFRIINDRYSIDLRSVIHFIHSRTKIRNKFYESGLGQYVEKFK